MLKCCAERFSTRAAASAGRGSESSAATGIAPSRIEPSLNCRSAQASAKTALMKISSSSAIFTSHATSSGTCDQGKAATTRRPGSLAPSIATSPPMIRIEAVARKLVDCMRLPIAAMSAMRFSRVSAARIQRRRCWSIAAMTLRARIAGTRSTTRV